jgi:hypothetical protein
LEKILIIKFWEVNQREYVHFLLAQEVDERKARQMEIT